MKITILQQDIEWANPAANVARADEAIDRNPGADLYVLPEMFSTGFCTTPEGVAESTNSDTLKWMQRKAAATNAAIAGSVAVTDGEHYYNRFYFVTPDGTTEYYDKHHLFTFGGEHLHFTAGDRRVIVGTQPRRLRYDTLRCKLARSARGCVEFAACGARYRKPMLCCGCKPRGQ